MSYVKINLKKTSNLLFSLICLLLFGDGPWMKVSANTGFQNNNILPQNQLFNGNSGLNYNQMFNQPSNYLENLQEGTDNDEIEELKTIRNIVVLGNVQVPKDAILIRIPYKIGQAFDPVLTGQSIRNLYQLKHFEFIEIKTKDVNRNKIDLFIIVKEKKKLESISYKGMVNLTEKEIEDKLHLSEFPAINQEEAEVVADNIKKLYQEKNYHDAKVIAEFLPTASGNLQLVFKIEEGRRAIVKQVEFVGNRGFPAKKLRSMIFTREDWILGAMDKAGTYQPEALEYDKYVLENFYQSNGYLAARITNIDVDVNPETQCIKVTYFVDEGDIYTIKCVSAVGNEILGEEQILAGIPIKPGQLYNKELINTTIEILRNTWGQFGYIYADIFPDLKVDYENKTVDIKFNSELGNQIFLNRINIIGNIKTIDSVIRRNLVLNEGELLTSQKMDVSKAHVESLGFFDPKDGVNWKVNKIDENTADLDLIVKEIKTGKLYGQLGWGGADLKSPSTSIKLMAGIADRNLLGTGIRYNFNVTWSKEDRGVFFSIFQPWLFDRPIGAGMDFYIRRAFYEDFKNVVNIPVENVTGIIGQMSFAPQRYPDLATIVNAGLEKITYDNPVLASTNIQPVQQRELFQALLDRRFQPGNLIWTGFLTGQDHRNHPVFPTKGYNWNISGKFGIPNPKSDFKFFKVDLDGTWLTPLIGDYDLIFLLHGHAGFAKPFGNGTVPYRELYHIGGPATVRGFNFGQIGPQIFGDSIGAQKAFWVNAELIFSVTKDQSIRALVFYDGGAGWDTPNASAFAGLPLINNRFRYRHAVGFGIRLTQPTPLRIDWGFKLDRDKRLGESLSEVHFSMAQDF